MSCRAIAVALGLGLAIGVAMQPTDHLAAAPIPKHLMKDSPSYFPTQVGAKWVYLYNGGEETRVVSKVETKEGEKIVTVEEVTPTGNRHHQTVSVRPTGLFLLSEGDKPYDSPWCLLKLPLQPDEVWETKPTWGAKDEGLTGTRKAVGQERVKVPAGEFVAARVEWNFTVNATRTKRAMSATYWFAPGIGVVRMEDPTRVLKSFTPGKE